MGSAFWFPRTLKGRQEGRSEGREGGGEGEGRRTARGEKMTSDVRQGDYVGPGIVESCVGVLGGVAGVSVGDEK